MNGARSARCRSTPMTPKRSNAQKKQFNNQSGQPHSAKSVVFDPPQRKQKMKSRRGTALGSVHNFTSRLQLLTLEKHQCSSNQSMSSQNKPIKQPFQIAITQSVTGVLRKEPRRLERLTPWMPCSHSYG